MHQETWAPTCYAALPRATFARLLMVETEYVEATSVEWEHKLLKVR